MQNHALKQTALGMDQQETLVVTLIRPIFRAPGDRAPFAVWAATSKGFPEFRVAGCLDEWGDPNDEVTLTGSWVDDPRYGRQFRALSVQPHIPSDARGLIRWLSRQKGIGQVTARRVVTALGADAMDVLSSDPDAVERIPGLSQAQRAAVLQAVDTYGEHREREQVITWCLQHGLGPAQAEAVFRAYGVQAPQMLVQDPWQLAELDRFGFLTADGLAQKLGVSADGDARLMASLRHVLDMAAVDDGHVFLPIDDLLDCTFGVLKDIAKKSGYGHGKGKDIFERLPTLLNALGHTGAIKLDAGRAYLPYLWRAEQDVRHWLARCSTVAGLMSVTDANELVNDPAIRGTMDEIQADAVAKALSHGASVLTGGPGTGKTTVTHMLLAALQRLQPSSFHPLLAAPTGRAAKRMAEVTGHKASTIHRMLEYNPSNGGFMRNEEWPLDGSFLLIDETSMADLPLFASLIRAVPDTMPVLLVGDANQLPPVGPGAPFQDIIRWELLPTARLERIYRQGAGSAIPVNARRVNDGQVPVPVVGDHSYRQTAYPRPPRGLSSAERERAGRALRERIAMDVASAVEGYLKDGWAPHDIQVLAAIRRGPLGTVDLNERLRPVLNPKGQAAGVFSTRGGRELWVGDRVIHIRNDYDKGVFNGEIGQVVAVNVPVTVSRRGEKRTENGIRVAFEDGMGVRYVPYWVGDVGDLELAYATTVHKSQGGEFPVVVFALGWDSYTLLKRNLVYTALTRAREVAIVLVEQGAMEQAVRSSDAVERHQDLGGLVER